MRRLFFRVYLALALVLAGSLAVLWLLAPAPDEMDVRYQVEQRLALPPDEVSSRLNRAETPDERERERAALEHELGDVLFAVVNLARHLALDAETALAAANRRFIARFQHMERTCEDRNTPLASLDEAALDRPWEAAKHAERRGPSISRSAAGRSVRMPLACTASRRGVAVVRTANPSPAMP